MYMYINMYIGTIRLSYCSCSFCHIGIVCCIQSIIYCMVKRWELYSPSAIVDCYIWWCWYVQWNNNNGLVCCWWWWWCWIMSTYFLILLSRPCPSFPTRIITTLSFQAVTYLLVVVVIDIYIYIYKGIICLWYYMIVSCW